MENITSAINPATKILEFISNTNKLTKNVINGNRTVTYNNINKYIITYAAADQRRRRVKKRFKRGLQKYNEGAHLPINERLFKQLEHINRRCRILKGLINNNILAYNDIPERLRPIVEKIDLSEIEIVIPVPTNNNTNNNTNNQINNDDDDDDVDWQDGIEPENTSGKNRRVKSKKRWAKSKKRRVKSKKRRAKSKKRRVESKKRRAKSKKRQTKRKKATSKKTFTQKQKTRRV